MACAEFQEIEKGGVELAPSAFEPIAKTTRAAAGFVSVAAMAKVPETVCPQVGELKLSEPAWAAAQAISRRALRIKFETMFATGLLFGGTGKIL
jgi:hypothetical protein